MADPIINVERAKVEEKIKSLIEQLKKQESWDKTQYLRGQIAAWEAIERWNEPKTHVKQPDPDKPKVPLYS